MELDLLGAQPALFKLYTQLAIIFRAPEQVQHDTIVSTLTAGLERLAQAFPWIAGQVINTNHEPDGCSSYRIRPLEAVPRLIVKNYENDAAIPTLAQLEEAQYPMSMLHEDVWGPCPTIASLAFDPTKPSGSGNEPAPVMLVQLSFIKDGLVLCINMQHNVCDMMGQAAVMGWLSRACRNEKFTADELEFGNADRRATVPLNGIAAQDVRDDLEDQLLPINNKLQGGGATTDTPAPAPVPPRCSWAYYKFISSSQQRLKDLATTELPEDFTKFISTDDALSAFIFKSVLRARRHRLSDETRVVSLARAVDARRYLNVPADYPGILQNMAYTRHSLADLSNLSLGHIAAGMRRQVDPETSNVARRTRSLITFLSQAPENSLKVSFTARQNYDADIALSSWSKVPAYDWDFGLGLGSAVAVRRPGFLPVESLMYIMPKDRDGSTVVAMCLREEDVERLHQDEEWTCFVEYVG
ncbi:transferase family-domain-containing protein [Ampelomyces quisqualis]|uniref:Transferase family-domain-containing protein n=1 Tax=Ampelomyces quisqualis TaxID=50730 RepID=A0A6A5QXJ2_AMPQU|nr:transferase family-domain-containing protein [Ampelomyces quisqualis]